MVIEKYENYVVLENEGVKFLYYDASLNRGNTIIIEGTIELLIDSEFNRYLKTQNIHYLVRGSVIYNDNYLSYNEELINSLLSKKDEYNKSILKLILFNKKDEINLDFYEYFKTFSINYLIVISGYHINLLFRILEKKKSKYFIVIIYLYLLNFSVSSFKSFLYYCLKKINKKANLILNNSDLLSLIMMCFLFINPCYCFNKGFIYSFVFSFILDFLNNTIPSKKIWLVFLKKILIFFSSLPIILLDNYSINSNSFFVSLMLSNLISFLFIFSLVYLIFDKFYLIYKLYIFLLKLLLDFFMNYSIEFVFGKPSLIIVVLLYGCLLLFLYCYENRVYKLASFYLSMFIFVSIIQYSLGYIDNREIVYFLDVGQGDCTILKIKNSKKVVLIDTGGSIYKDVANDTIIPFLKSKGINRIDKIIISHDDYDHNGAKEELINNFNINEVIENSNIKSVNIGDKIFTNLNVNDLRDNDGSIVLVGEFGGIRYLFTGDISSLVESRLIDTDIDILKVSHHGSNSSSSYEFLKSTSPRIALIGVGKNNKYGHPSSEVLDRLNDLNIKIYRTDIDGTIEIYKNLITNKIFIRKL